MSNTINCNSCLHKYTCEKIAKDGGFQYWGCFLRLLYNNFRPKWLFDEIIKESKKFLEYEVSLQGDLWMCDAPYGNYVWHFAVRMKQEQIWNYREFQEGYKFGLNPEEPYRDANPYFEPERLISWDCGYILGLHNAEQALKGGE